MQNDLEFISATLKECGVENQEEFMAGLFENYKPIELLLEYHTKLSDVTISAEEQNRLLTDYYNLLKDPVNIERMKNFVDILKKIDTTCLARKIPCDSLKHMDELNFILSKYGSSIKDLMKWVAKVGLELSDHCNIEMSGLKLIYDSACDINKKESEQDNNLMWIIIIILVVIYLII